MIKPRFLAAFLIVLFGIQLPFSCPAFAQNDDDNTFLLLYFNEEDLFVESSTRGRKSLTRAAENITIVTAQEIKLMNAHTLAEVLNTVPGVHVFLTGGPGSMAQASIQGSETRHVAVFIDGVPLNNLSDSLADVGSVPVQHIEKIEIIEGPASSAWGSALGGVINIITKSGRSDEVSGSLSASYGKANTGDFRAEASGRGERLGYFITAGRLQTDGFRPHNDFSGNNGFAKLSYDITNSTQVMVSTSYEQFDRGVVEYPSYDLYINNEIERARSTLSVTSAVNREVTINLGLWQLRQEYDDYDNLISTGLRSPRASYDDTSYGSTAKLNWKHEGHHLVLGTDLAAGKLQSARIAGSEHSQRKYAYYINDTITFSRFSVTPGLRRDDTSTNGDMNSPSLGITWKPADAMLLRAYAARGFSIPPLSSTYGDNIIIMSNPGLRMEQVRSYQAGVETTALPYVWLKLDFFAHKVTDVIKNIVTPGFQYMAVNGGKARREGLEVEMKSRPVHGASLSAGAVFMNTKDITTGRTVQNVPQRTYDAGLHYDDNANKVLLKGHYVYWNSHPTFQGKYNSMIFDLTATRVLSAGAGKSVEAFINVHNLFNGEQYPISDYKNPRRWLEGGVRYLF